MAVLSGATASGRVMYAGSLSNTGGTVLYTAPSASTNVTSPSATAYIKEIVLCNYTSGAATVNISVNGGIGIIQGVTVNANDTKVLSGLNTMLNAGSTITGSCPTGASAISVVISGVEVQ